MPIKFEYYIPKLFSLFLVLVAAGSFTFLVNFNALEIVNRPLKTITPENFEAESVGLKDSDNVLINGTINYLRVISDEGENVYYAGLEEFGDKIILRIPKNLFEGSSQKSIQGNVKLLDNSSFSNSLISKLNEKGNIDNINESDLNQLDSSVKEKIAESLQGNFSTDSILVIAGQRFEREKVYLETLSLGVLTVVFLVILLRNKVLYS